MGYIKHDTIVVTTWDDDAMPKIHAKAVELLGAIPSATSGEGEGYNLVSPVVGPLMNGQSSFLVAPDGSKEGWDMSEAADEARRAFLEWLQHDAHQYATALVVRFGGDDEDLSCRVVEAVRGEGRPE